MGRRAEPVERTCLGTRAVAPPAALLRFVRAPDGAVVPDVTGKLPGRGVWVTARRDVVEQAVRKRLFARGFKGEAVADPGLPELVDRLLADRALRSLSMARKAGRVVTGFGKVTTALGRGGVVAVIHAAEAADDGRRKVMQAMSRRARRLADEADADRDAGIDAVDDDLDEDVESDEDDGSELEPRPVSAAAMPRVIRGLFGVAELDLALGGPNVIHAALLAGGASTSFLNNAAALARYRGGQPETDWMAGNPESNDSGDPQHDWSLQDPAVATGDADETTGED
ncbi:MAG TPA: DUF448 domain-containing protein [Methylomirabilota bacterium]|nr:DUF448 domain-containing protein [Methylomirabilota bacterium]